MRLAGSVAPAAIYSFMYDTHSISVYEYGTPVVCTLSAHTQA